FDFAEFAVAVVVGGIVAEGVLAAQFLGNLVEGLFQLFFGVDVDHATAGIIGQAPSRSSIGAIARVGDEQHVNHGVGTLGSLNRFLKLHLATLVLGIGDDHDSFAPRLAVQLFAARKV